MAIEALQRVFKTLTDPTRMRILALLEREELAVQELVRILDTAQSTVSRHLSLLREAGLLHERREGTYTYHRFLPPSAGVWSEAWQIASRALSDDPLGARDGAALESCLRERAFRSQRWFESVGPEWDALREVFDDDLQRARAIAKLLPAKLRVADVGTGTGILAQDLARAGLEVIAIDNSRRMLAAADAKLAAAGVDSVELRHGDAIALPLDDGEVDAAFAHMVLQYVASPAVALRELARVVRAGGRVVVIDFVENDREWMKKELGVMWQGFSEDMIRKWFAEAGLVAFEFELHDPVTRSNKLPATFIAWASRLEGSDR